VAVTLVGLLALNYPLLELFNRAALVAGVPLLYVYLFIAWGLLIGAIAAVMERKEASGTSGPEPPSPAGD
jgi:hypothetical protein